MKLRAIFAVALIAISISPSQAAVKKVVNKAITVVAAKPLITTTLSGNIQDQILGATSGPNAIVVTGVVESGTEREKSVGAFA